MKVRIEREGYEDDICSGTMYTGNTYAPMGAIFQISKV